MTDPTDRREQAAKQCDVVAHLAIIIAELHKNRANILRSGDGRADGVIEITGARTAYLMEVLGDVLNGMDAAKEDDEWVDQIYEDAHRLWPHP